MKQQQKEQAKATTRYKKTVLYKQTNKQIGVCKTPVPSFKALSLSFFTCPSGPMYEYDPLMTTKGGSFPMDLTDPSTDWRIPLEASKE